MIRGLRSFCTRDTPPLPVCQGPSSLRAVRPHHSTGRKHWPSHSRRAATAPAAARRHHHTRQHTCTLRVQAARRLRYISAHRASHPRSPAISPHSTSGRRISTQHSMGMYLEEVAEVGVDAAGGLAEKEQRVAGAKRRGGGPREAPRRTLLPRRLRHACALGGLFEAWVVQRHRRRPLVLLPPLLPAPQSTVTPPPRGGLSGT